MSSSFCSIVAGCQRSADQSDPPPDRSRGDLQLRFRRPTSGHHCDFLENFGISFFGHRPLPARPSHGKQDGPLQGCKDHRPTHTDCLKADCDAGDRKRSCQVCSTFQKIFLYQI